MRKGFFVPHSQSSDYVSNKRGSGGAYKWDQAAGEVGLQQQAAFQTLNKQYSTTIDAAYTNYLAASRGIQGSTMGEGYKEAYKQATQEGLQANIAETNMNAAQARMEITQQSLSKLQNIGSMFEAEVANMDRVGRTMEGYLSYLDSLMGAPDSKIAGQKFLSEDQVGKRADTMYDMLFAAQPRGYLDAEGREAMSYSEWINSQMKDNQADVAWSNWLFGQGGLQQFRNATKKGIKPL